MNRPSLLLLLVGLAIPLGAQTPLSANAPADRPVAATRQDQYQELRKAIEPYVERARKTWPDAKGRYIHGLPKGQIFYVSVELRDERSKAEIVFVEVVQITKQTIVGVIANDINTVSGYSHGDRIQLKDTDVLDWTISMPDGTEEGNVVGKFLDSYHPE